MSYFIGHDLGTHGNKAVLVSAEGRVLATARSTFGLVHPGPGMAEQDPADWWRAVALCTREVVERAGVPPRDIRAVAFAGQMLALVPMDAAHRPVGRCICWLDGRAGSEAAALTRRLGGATVCRALAGATPGAKDIVPKVWWLRRERPHAWERVRYLTDATGCLVAMATGRTTWDVTGAAATGLIDGRRRTWSRVLARLASFPLDRTAPLLECTAIAGELSSEAASALGLRAGTPVAAGLADIPAAAVGAGATRVGDVHVCLGTSSWVAMTLERPRHVPKAGMVSTAAAAPGTHLLIGENETAGACAAWLAREVWPEGGADVDEVLGQVDRLAGTSEAGAGGLIFAPWMFGERSPVPDASLRGAFLGLSLEHRRAEVVRAVHEGIALNLAWTLQEGSGSGQGSGPVRVVGGGTASTTLLQALADALDHPLEVAAAAPHAGAVGAAMIAAVAVGEVGSVAEIRERVEIRQRVEPRRANVPIYRELLSILREAQPALSRVSARLEPFRRSEGHGATSGGA